MVGWESGIHRSLEEGHFCCRVASQENLAVRHAATLLSSCSNTSRRFEMDVQLRVHKQLFLNAVNT